MAQEHITNAITGEVVVRDMSEDEAEASRLTIEQLRARASLSKDDFILAALDAGILSEADAEEATTGWPTGWSDFFNGKPARDRIAAKAEWASTRYVRRTAPLVAALAAFKGLSEEQVDALFGIGG